VTQAVLTYLLVAIAAAWVVWSTLMPKAVKQTLRAKLVPQKAAPAAKAGCDCGGDGGCH
jgi:hypothetical protein